MPGKFRFTVLATMSVLFAGTAVSTAAPAAAPTCDADSLCVYRRVDYQPDRGTIGVGELNCDGRKHSMLRNWRDGFRSAYNNTGYDITLVNDTASGEQTRLIPAHKSAPQFQAVYEQYRC